MRRGLIGHERTRARRAVVALSGRDPAAVAKLLAMRKHTIAAILRGRMLPGRVFAERVASLTPAS